MLNEQNEYSEPDSGLVARRDIRERLAIGLAGFCVILALGAAATFQELQRQSKKERQSKVAEIAKLPDSSFEENIALAHNFLEDADFGAGAATFTAALSVTEKDRELAEAFLGRGVSNALNGDWEDAESDFEETLSLLPRTSAARLNLALSLENQGQLADALRELERCLAYDADNPYALGNAARVAFELQQFETSLQHLSCLVVQFPDDATVRFNRALTFAQAGKLSSAISDLQHPAVQQEATPAVQTILASLLAKQGRSVESLSVLRPVLDLGIGETDQQANHASVLVAAGALASLMVDGEDSSAPARVALRKIAVDDLELDEIPNWSADLATLESSFQADGYCAINPLDFSRLDTAVSVASASVAEKSYLQGLELIQAGDFFASRAALTRCLRIQPAHVNARKRRAVIELDIGDYKASIEDVDFLLASTPDDPELWTVRATAAARSKQFDSAIAALDHAVRLEQKNPVVYANRALTRYASKSDPKLTIIDIERAERLGLVTAELLHIKAAALMQLNENEAALGLQNEVLEMEPNNPSFLVQRAKANRVCGNLQLALEDAASALALDGSFLEGHIESARASYALKDWTGLREATESAEALGWCVEELREMQIACFKNTDDYDSLRDLLSEEAFELLDEQEQQLLTNAELRSTAIDSGIDHAVQLAEEHRCNGKLLELATAKALERGKPVETHQLLGELLRNGDPERTAYYLEMARCCQAIGSASESLIWLAKYLERVPESSEAWQLTGDAMLQKQKTIDALKCYSQAIGFDPKNRTALLARAKLLLKVRKYQLAKSDLEILARSDTPPRDVADLLAQCDSELMAAQSLR